MQQLILLASVALALATGFKAGVIANDFTAPVT